MILIKNSMLFLLALFITVQSSKASFHYKNFEQLNKYCIEKLPTLKALNSITNKINFQALFNNKKDFQTFRALDANEFELVFDQFFAMSDVSSLAQNYTWVNGENLNANFSDAYALPYTPYAQKVLVNNLDTIALRGDMHGDIQNFTLFF